MTTYNHTPHTRPRSGVTLWAFELYFLLFLHLGVFFSFFFPFLFHLLWDTLYILFTAFTIVLRAMGKTGHGGGRDKTAYIHCGVRCLGSRDTGA